MRGRQAKSLRRMARALTVGQPAVAYQTVQQRSNTGAPCAVRIAQASPLHPLEPAKPLRARVREHGTTKYGQYRRVWRLTDAPLVLSHGTEPRLDSACTRGMYQTLKRNYKRLRSADRRAVSILNRLRTRAQ